MIAHELAALLALVSVLAGALVGTWRTARRARRDAQAARRMHEAALVALRASHAEVLEAHRARHRRALASSRSVIDDLELALSERRARVRRDARSGAPEHLGDRTGSPDGWFDLTGVCRPEWDEQTPW